MTAAAAPLSTRQTVVRFPALWAPPLATASLLGLFTLLDWQNNEASSYVLAVYFAAGITTALLLAYSPVSIWFSASVGLLVFAVAPTMPLLIAPLNESSAPSVWPASFFVQIMAIFSLLSLTVGTFLSLAFTLFRIVTRTCLLHGSEGAAPFIRRLRVADYFALLTIAAIAIVIVQLDLHHLDATQLRLGRQFWTGHLFYSGVTLMWSLPSILALLVITFGCRWQLALVGIGLAAILTALYATDPLLRLSETSRVFVLRFVPSALATSIGFAILLRWNGVRIGRRPAPGAET